MPNLWIIIGVILCTAAILASFMIVIDRVFFPDHEEP